MIRLLIKIFNTVLICFIFSNAIFSNTNYYKFYNIGRNDGLSQSTVNSIIKDSLGFMWFGTNDGLNRYNGIDFKCYRYETDNPNSLNIGRITCLFIDNNKDLWVSTDQGGLNYYQKDKDNFIRYHYSFDDTKTISTNDIRAILENNNNELILATFGDGILLFNKSTHKFSKLASKYIEYQCMTFDSSGDLITGSTSGVELFPKLKYSTENVKSQSISKFAGYDILALYTDDKDQLWIGTYSHGAFAYNLESYSTISYSTNSIPQYRIGHKIIRSFVKMNNSIWIGTGGGGIFQVGPKMNIIGSINNILNNSYSLHSDIIYCFYNDDNNNLWIGTYNSGIDILFDCKDKFKHIKSFGEPDNISNNKVLSILEDKEGYIWVGTDGGGLNKFNPIDNNFVHYKNDPNNSTSISGNVVKSLLVDHLGNLWVGTFNEGLNLFNSKNGTFKKFYHSNSDSNTIASNLVWDMAEDKNGIIWIATLNSGVDSYNPYTNHFTHYKHHENDSLSLVDNNVSVVKIDKIGNVWIGTEYGGISVLNKGFGTKFTDYKHSDRIKNSLSSNQVCAIFPDSKGNIWIGTLGGGINIFNNKTNDFKFINKKKGLPSDLIYAFLEDKNGDMWVSSNNGLSEIKNTILEFTYPQIINFSTSDGLQSNEFNPQSACKARNETMYFGGNNGINFFKADQMKYNTVIPSVVLTDFLIYNKHSNYGDMGSPLKKSILYAHQIVLNFQQRVFSFRFAALNFVSPDKNNYAYKLEGFDKDWNYVGNKHEATYTNLDPGEYIFNVKASNNDGYWNNKGTTIKIIILPPFWKTWWFRAFVILVLITLILSYYWIRVKFLQNQNIVLERKIEERTRELSDVNNELTEKNNWILAQNEEITSQNVEIFNKNEEILQQKELLEEQKSKIEIAYNELSQYRNKLEELVEERTKELIIAKEKAEESDKLKSSFLANLSHEIRTPLNSIIGFSFLICDPLIQQEERLNFKSIIERSSNSLLNLINDIIDFSKIEAGHIDIFIKSNPLIKIINDIEDIYEYEIKKQQFSKENKLDFRLNIDEKDKQLIIETDEIRVTQILTNLISNAIKFTEQGYIEVGCSLKSSENLIEFYVKDTGIGIKEEDQEIIFQRFRKLEDDNSTLYRGAGLGLSISKHLVELLGGKIWVNSSPGKGSTFRFTIPYFYIEALPKAEIKKKNKNTIDLNNDLILVAEDDYSNFQYIEKLLEKANAQIIHASNGKEVINFVINNPEIKIILMDIKMPEMNGIESLLELKKRNYTIPVIAQTAYAFSDELKQIIEAGFVDYIIKPINPNELFQLLMKYHS